MTHAYRTVARRVGHACAFGCLLVGTPALASYEVLHSHSTAARSGQYIESSVSAVMRPVNGGANVYTKQLVPVATSTLRKGALSALSRGIMHPGFQVAVLAAGFILGNSDSELDDNTIYKPGSSGPGITDVPGDFSQSVVVDGVVYSSPGQACSNDPLNEVYTLYQIYDSGTYARCLFGWPNSSGGYTKQNTQHVYYGTQGEPYTPAPVPITSEDYPLIDPHIPPQLYDEIYSDGEPIPEWQNEISVMGSPATDVQSDNPLAPEIAQAVGQWGANAQAALNGDPLPHPESPSTGQTSYDLAYEDQVEQWNEPPPPFPEPEIAWQTEVLDLPSFSSGIGGGSCPGPASIPLPGGANPVTISYQPACDLATMVRPALIGVCGLIACMIVLRARGGA